jgi:hypothetical protein
VIRSVTGRCAGWALSGLLALGAAACDSDAPAGDAGMPPPPPGDAADVGPGDLGDAAVTLDTAPADAAPPRSWSEAAVYFATAAAVFQIPPAGRPAPFAAVAGVDRIVPSPGGQRVALQRPGGVEIHAREGGRLAAFDVRPGLLGWVDEDTLLFFDRQGTASLHRGRIDGTDRRDLPNPVQHQAIALAAASLAPDGRQAVVVMESLPLAPGSGQEPYRVSTHDGAIAAKLDGRAGARVLWAQDGRILWLEPMQMLVSVGSDGRATRVPLGFEPCAFLPWAGAHLLIGRLVPRADTFDCAESLLMRTDGQQIRPAAFDLPAPHRLVVAASPDGQKVVLWHQGQILVANADGTGPQVIAEQTAEVSAFGW